MKKLLSFVMIFFLISIFGATAESNEEKPLQMKMTEIQEIPALSMDAEGNITNTAKPLFGTGEIREIDIGNFKNWKKEIKFSEEFVGQPEENKTILFIIAIDDKNEIFYIKEVDIKKDARNGMLSIKFLKIPINIVSIKIVLLEQMTYKVIPVQLIYKGRKPPEEVSDYQSYEPYEYVPPTIIGH